MNVCTKIRTLSDYCRMLKCVALLCFSIMFFPVSLFSLFPKTALPYPSVFAFSLSGLTLTMSKIICSGIFAGPGGDMQWCFSQVKGAIDDDVAEGMSSTKNYFHYAKHSWVGGLRGKMGGGGISLCRQQAAIGETESPLFPEVSSPLAKHIVPEQPCVGL